MLLVIKKWGENKIRIQKIHLQLPLLLLLHTVGAQHRQFIHVPTQQYASQPVGPPQARAAPIVAHKSRGPLPNGRAFGYQTQGSAPVVSSAAVVSGGQSSCAGSSCSGAGGKSMRCEEV
jgi:hypothetical protein